MSNTLTTREQAQAIGEVMMSGKFRENLSQSMGVREDDPIIDRFARVAMRAVQSDPKLLNADRQSLFLACQEAATDGLMPDGKQGKLVVYSTKQDNQWVDKVQWQRMVGGLRTLAARHDFDIVAHVVHENDEFDQRFGSDPGVTHKPARLGQPRGDVIGFYAIATNLKTGKQYFEVMDKAGVDGIMARTKSKDRAGAVVGPWKSDYIEMGRKTLAKKLFKSLPIADDDEDIQRFIARDNEEYVSTVPRTVRGPSSSSVAQIVNQAVAADVIDAEPTEPLQEPKPAEPEDAPQAAPEAEPAPAGYF